MEYSIQSWLLENRYNAQPNGPDKFEQVFSDPDSERFKVDFISNLNFLDSDQKASIKDAYHRISEFVHPQKTILERVKVVNLVTFSLDPDMLKTCADFAVEAADIMAVVLIEKYPGLKSLKEFRDIASSLNLQLSKTKL